MKVNYIRVSTGRSIIQKNVCEAMTAHKTKKKQTGMSHDICLDDASATAANSNTVAVHNLEYSPV